MKIKYRKLNLISVVQYRYDYINNYSLPTGRVGGVFEGDVLDHQVDNCTGCGKVNHHQQQSFSRLYYTDNQLSSSYVTPGFRPLSI